MFKQEVPKIGLSIEQGTPAVPDDGHYYVLLDGEVVFRSRSQAQALSKYRKHRDERLGPTPPKQTVNPAKALQRERLYVDLQAVKSESRTSKMTKRLRKGGKGR